MKPFLFLVISCLALHNGQGAPTTAVYKFVRCNPEGDQANCVTYQGPEIAWSPELPAKLPGSAAEFLEAKPVEEESKAWEEEKQDYDYEEEIPMKSEDGESPVNFLPEEGSGGFEGSGAEVPPMKDQPYETTEAEMGSGETDLDLGDDVLRQLFPGKSPVGEPKPAEQELKEDHLLKL